MKNDGSGTGRRVFAVPTIVKSIDDRATGKWPTTSAQTGAWSGRPTD